MKISLFLIHRNILHSSKINRPSKLNALNQVTIASLSQAFHTLEKDDTIRVIVLTGAGEKAFVAGADISEFAPIYERRRNGFV